MMAELLGGIDAPKAFVNALAVRIRAYLSRGCLLSAHAQNGSRPSPEQIIVHGERGFTLTELMVALAIVGVLSAAAAPSVSAMIASQRVKTATFDIYAATSYARSEAIKRNSVVIVAPRGGNFANGYELQAGGLVLSSQLGTPSVIIIAPSEIALAFNGYGRLTTSASYQLELSSSLESSIAKRCLLISTSGRPSIRVDSNHDGNCING